MGWFHSTLFWASDYYSMLGFKLDHISKRGPWWQSIMRFLPVLYDFQQFLISFVGQITSFTITNKIQRVSRDFRVESSLLSIHSYVSTLLICAQLQFLGWLICKSYYLSTARFMATVISKQLRLKILWTKAVDGPTFSLCVCFAFFV